MVTISAVTLLVCKSWKKISVITDKNISYIARKVYVIWICFYFVSGYLKLVTNS